MKEDSKGRNHANSHRSPNKESGLGKTKHIFLDLGSLSLKPLVILNIFTSLQPEMKDKDLKVRKYFIEDNWLATNNKTTGVRFAKYIEVNEVI